jgi:hypothetical protein
MAVRKAQATGNWNSTATWSGGVIPSLNDTVYANGFTVTINQNIDLTGSIIDTSGSFIPGQIYKIVSLGTTNFGLTANCIVPGTNAGTAVAITPAVGAIFQAVNAGTVTTGTAVRVGALLNYINTPLTIVTGGGFSISTTFNVTGAYIQAGSINCLTISGASSPTLTNCRAIGSSINLSTRAILFSSTGTLILNAAIVNGGRVSGTTVASSAIGVENTSTGSIQFTNSSSISGGIGNFSIGLNNNAGGSITFTTGTITSGSATASLGINNNSSGSLTISSASISGGSAVGVSTSTGPVNISSSSITGGTIAGAYGVNNTTTGTITITGSTITGGTNATAYGVNNATTGIINATTTNITASATTVGLFNAATGSITSTGNITASSVANGLVSLSASAQLKVSGSLISAVNGMLAVSSPKFLVDPEPTTAIVRFAKNGTSTYTNFLSLGYQPLQADVRFGTVYANGSYTGTLRVPSPSSVAFGALTDNTTGTAVLTQSAIWDTLTSSMTTSGSIGERLANASTVAVTGQQITNALG